MSLNKKIAKDSIIVTFLGLIGQVFAFITTLLMANFFGASIDSDAFFLAFVYPSITVAVFSNIMKIMLIPKMIHIRINKPAEFKSFINSAFSIFLILSVIFSFFLFWLAKEGLLFPNTAKVIQEKSYILLALMLILIPMNVLYYLKNALYTSYQKFAAAESVMFFKYLVIAASVYFLSEKVGILSLVIGHITGQSIALVLFHIIMKKKKIPSFSFRADTKYIKTILSLGFWPFLTSIVLQVELLNSRLFSAMLEEGSLSCYSYAERITAIPSLIIGSGFLTVIMSYWSKSLSTGNTEELKRSINLYLKLLLIAIVPMAAGLFLLRYEVIDIILNRGKFSAEDVNTTASILAIIIIALPLTHMNKVFYRIININHDYNISFLFSLLNAISLPLFSFLLIFSLSLSSEGIALSLLLSTIIQSILLIIFIQKKYYFLKNRSLIKTAVKSLISASIMILILSFFPAGSFIMLLLISITGAMLYFIIMYLLKSPEVIKVCSYAKSYITRN